MSKNRAKLIRKANQLPQGSPERREILAALKTAKTMAIEVQVNYDSGLGWDELGFYEETPEEVATQEAILSYLGKRTPEDLRVLGEEPGAAYESALRDAFKKGRKIGKTEEGDVYLGSFGRTKAVMLDGYATGYLV